MNIIKSPSALHLYRLCIVLFLILATYPLLSQESFSLNTSSFEANQFLFESDFYQVYSSVSRSHARNISIVLETYIQFFSQYLRFDPLNLDNKFRVRLFIDPSEYKRYLTDIVFDDSKNFVYVHTNRPNRSELVGLVSDTTSIDPSLVHQAFIQYFRSFIYNPPLWMREGLAMFFENTRYQNSEIQIAPGYPWLESLKNLLFESPAETIDINRLLVLDLDEAVELVHSFYPQSWGLVYYFLHDDDPSNNRLFWDSLRILEKDADLNTNSRLLRNYIFRWITAKELRQSMENYYQNFKTYRELIEESAEQYAEGLLDQAEMNLQEAILRGKMSYIPYYYLGLIYYDRQNYFQAEDYYLNAIDYGQDDSLIYYALGLNAFSNEEYIKANRYFDRAENFELANSFAERIDAIRQRIIELRQ